MTRARRMVVAFEEVESPQGRMLRDFLDGEVPFAERRTPRRLGRYWCVADKPNQGDDFRLTTVGRTSTVPPDARCEECGIHIRELQAMMAPQA